MESARDVIPLSRELILSQALAIADREGLAAVSMRRIGAELGYSGMSLYSHVASKDELLRLLVDHIFGLVPPVDPAVPWRTAILEFFLRLRATMLGHAAIARLAADAPVDGGHSARHTRDIVTALRRAGLPAALAFEAFVALSCYTLGAVLYTAGRPAPPTIDSGEREERQPVERDHVDAENVEQRFVEHRPVEFRRVRSHSVESRAVEQHAVSDKSVEDYNIEKDTVELGLGTPRTGVAQFRGGLEHLLDGYAAHLRPGPLPAG